MFLLVERCFKMPLKMISKGMHMYGALRLKLLTQMTAVLFRGNELQFSMDLSFNVPEFKKKWCLSGKRRFEITWTRHNKNAV